jgi:DNA-directed RNA polymerase specialized sigma24 family protein
VSLTEALRTGAPDAFGALYDEYAGPLHAYCHVMVGDEAADAVRDTFIAVARHPGEAPSDDGALPVWLYALARSECVRRGALVRRAVSASPADPLRRALTLLRPEHREALALSTVLEPEEIARVVGVARDTAEMLVRVSQRRLEQAAASVGGREAHDAAMLTSLSADALNRLVTRGYEPPPRQRERVLSSCAAAERAADGALLFDADGMPIPLDGLFQGAEEPTRPFTRISPEEPAREVGEVRQTAARSGSSEPAPQAVRASHAEPKASAKKQPFLRRRHDNLVEVAGLAACVAVATGVLALWPNPHPSGTSNVDGTSLLIHRGQTASRSAQPSVPPRSGPPDAATSKPGTSASPEPTTSTSTAPTAAPPGSSAPAGPSHPATPPKNGGPGAHPTHPTHPAPPTSPPGSPTTTPTPDPTPTPSGSPGDNGPESATPDPSGS